MSDVAVTTDRLTHVTHPLVQHKLSYLRDRDTPTVHFRKLVNELTLLLTYEATKDFPTEPVEIETPLEKMDAQRISGKKVAVCPVLRAGVGMLDGVLSLVSSARVGFIGLYRDEETLQPVEYYVKLPQDVADRDVILLDPMLATGNSTAHAVQLVKDAGATSVRLISIIAAPEGIANIEQSHPDVQIVVASIDRVEVLSLVDALGRYLAFTRRARRAPQKIIRQRHAFVLRDELRRGPHVTFAQFVPRAHQSGQLIQHALRPRHVLRFPFDDELVAVGTDPHPKLGLEVFEVLVEAAEQRLDVLVWNGDLADDSSGGYGVCSWRPRKGTPGDSLLQGDRGPGTRDRANPGFPEPGFSRTWNPRQRKCNSFSCFALTLDGASAMRSTACAVFGNAMTSRIEFSAQRIATIRSRPSAMPPCGGVPYSSASRKKPKRSFASSSEICSSLKIRRCSVWSWILMLPPAISLPFSTRS